MEELQNQFETFFNKYEELGDSDLYLLPIPNFMIEKDPVKYGGYKSVGEYKYIKAVETYIQLSKESKEKADLFWEDYELQYKKSTMKKPELFKKPF